MQAPLQAPNISKKAAYGALLTAGWIAAATFLVAKKTTETFAPLELGWFRIELSFILIFLLANVRRPKEEQLPLSSSDKLRLVALGLCGVTVNQLMFLHGIKYASPIDAALLYAFTPVAVLLGARLFLGEALTSRKVFGILCALVGVVMVLSDRGLNISSEHILGDGLLVIAMLAWAAYTLLGKDLMKRLGAMRANVWAFGVGALSMLPLTPWLIPDFDWSGPGWMGWLGMFWLAGMTSVVSFTLWTWALKRLAAAEVAVFTNLQPAMTALLAWLIFEEIPTLMVVIGGCLVIGGVVLTQRKPS